MYSLLNQNATNLSLLLEQGLMQQMVEKRFTVYSAQPNYKIKQVLLNIIAVVDFSQKPYTFLHCPCMNTSLP